MRNVPSPWLRGAAVAALVAAGACAHAPPSPSDAASASGERREAPERAIITGSRIPRPVGRDGVPVSEMAVKIYHWRHPPMPADADLARALRRVEPAIR